MNTTAEVWKPVVGYEGHYEVSNHGRVRSLDRVVVMKDGRKKTLKGIVRKQQTLPHGYKTLKLGLNGRLKAHYPHRLVLEAFIGPCPDGMETCHNNGNPEDNHLENLRWDTVAANNRDVIMHGNHNHYGKTHCIRGHAFTSTNTRVDKSGHRWCRECCRGRKWEKSDAQLYSGSCGKGHAFTRENTYVKRNGQRQCRECQKIWEKSRTRSRASK